MKIQRGLKVPAKKKTGRPRTYDFAKLRIGDAFTIQADKWPSVRSIASRYRRDHNERFALQAGEPTAGRMRVWRVA
jgi:hypothetical protein